MTVHVPPPETDWPSVILRAFNLAIAAGAIEPADDEGSNPWATQMPSWRRAAEQYHRDRAGRTSIVETGRENKTRPAAAATVDLDLPATRCAGAGLART